MHNCRYLRLIVLIFVQRLLCCPYSSRIVVYTVVAIAYRFGINKRQTIADLLVATSTLVFERFELAHLHHLIDRKLDLFVFNDGR
uniref:Putative secreted peptide n=1 Tax=Anopheles braziliensis TaxID=58242 RepID=A0A2M3ZN14_9DIPT